MNYYEHHLGDYAQATAHLSMLEDAAYSRMLRWYYAEEKPLPADLRAVCRIVRASSEQEREAVSIVLEEFFTLEADGWHQKRADAELDRYRAKSEKARRSAGARWNASNSQCETDAKSVSPALPTHSDRNANASPKDANASKTDANAMLASNQTPVTKETALASQSAEPSPKGSVSSRGTRLPDDWVLTVAWAKEGAAARAEAGLSEIDLRTEAASFRDYWRAKSGKDATKADWLATWRNWCRKAGAPRQTAFAGTPPSAAEPRPLRFDEITV